MAPSGGLAGLQLFTLATQTKNQNMTYNNNSSSCCDHLQQYSNYLKCQVTLTLSAASP